VDDHNLAEQEEDQYEFVDYIGLSYVISKLIYEATNVD
jgi:hypothetical protein